MVWRENMSWRIIGRISSQGKTISFDAAAQLYHAGKLHEAELTARQIVDANPRHVDAMNLLGVIAHDVGRNDLAVTWLTRAIQIDPSQAKLFNNLGECFRATGHADEAIACFRAAMDRSPGDPNPRNNLAIVQAALGHLDAAIATWREVIALFSGLHQRLQQPGQHAPASRPRPRGGGLSPPGDADGSQLDITAQQPAARSSALAGYHGRRAA
jgi:predicted Zn-dependent protease